MKGFKQARAQRAALKARGIKPGKQSNTNKFGQATGGWSPFAAPEAQTALASTTRSTVLGAGGSPTSARIADMKRKLTRSLPHMGRAELEELSADYDRVIETYGKWDGFDDDALLAIMFRKRRLVAFIVSAHPDITMKDYNDGEVVT